MRQVDSSSHDAGEVGPLGSWAWCRRESAGTDFTSMMIFPSRTSIASRR